LLDSLLQEIHPFFYWGVGVDNFTNCYEAAYVTV